MAHYDENSAECLVLTYKEGILSAVAHDLRLRVTRFAVDVEDASLAVKACFDATSLEVVSAMLGGAPRENALSSADKRKIEHSLTHEVLDAERFPAITFVSSSVTPRGAETMVTGELTLHGRTRSLTTLARLEGDRFIAEIELHQPDYGIKPYSAMLGALKIKPNVTIRMMLPSA